MLTRARLGCALASCTFAVACAWADTAARPLSLYSDADRLFIVGSDLPAGEGTTVRLGGEELSVVSATDTLIVVALPARLPAGDLRLILQRGVERIVYDQPGLTWGLRLPRP